jgi:hypothetical protein
MDAVAMHLMDPNELRAGRKAGLQAAPIGPHRGGIVAGQVGKVQ